MTLFLAKYGEISQEIIYIDGTFWFKEIAATM